MLFFLENVSTSEVLVLTLSTHCTSWRQKGNNICQKEAVTDAEVVVVGKIFGKCTRGTWHFAVCTFGTFPSCICTQCRNLGSTVMWHTDVATGFSLGFSFGDNDAKLHVLFHFFSFLSFWSHHSKHLLQMIILKLLKKGTCFCLRQS